MAIVDKKSIFLLGLMFVNPYQSSIHASNSNHDQIDPSGNPIRAVRIPFDTIDKNIKIKCISLAACDDFTDPRSFRLVCKGWKDLIDDLISQQNSSTKYSDLHPIWKSIYKTQFGGLGLYSFYDTFTRLKLIYETSPDKRVVLKFEDLNNPFCGEFNLDQCGDTSKDLRFTTKLKDFFELEGKNHNKFVVLFAPQGFIHNRIDSSGAPFRSIIDQCSSMFCMFFRWGNERDNTKFCYLIRRRLQDILKINLYSILLKAVSMLKDIPMDKRLKLRQFRLELDTEQTASKNQHL